MPSRLSTQLARHAARALALALTAATGAAAQSLPGALSFSAAGGVIRDNLTNTFSFTVGAADVLPADVGVTVRFRGLVDANAGDLYADLVFIPSGENAAVTRVRLFDFAPGGFGAARAFDGSYSVGSSFTEAMPGGFVKPRDYAAVDDLSAAFAGRSIAGTYQVQIIDWFSNGGGTVAGVDIAFDIGVSAVPEPATVALLGGGLLAIGALAARRRRGGP